jgi:hypothetical protein
MTTDFYFFIFTVELESVFKGTVSRKIWRGEGIGLQARP